MSGLVDVMDDLAKVGLEVTLGQVLEVAEGRGRDVPLPLEVALASLAQVDQVLVVLHEVGKLTIQFQLIGRDGALATSEGELSLLVIRDIVPCFVSCLPHVGGKDNKVVVLVDVVHDLHLEEGLGSIVHDLIGRLRLGNVLPQLLDASASSLGSSIFVNHLVTFVLGGNSVLQGGNKLLDDLKLSTEERILAGVHGVPVHLEEVKVDTGNCLNKSLEVGVDLELFEQAGDDTGSGCPERPTWSLM